MAYQVPQITVQINAQPTPAVVQDTKRVCIVGGHAQLMRYDNEDIKSLLRLGTYDKENDTAYLWPNRSAGAVVDQDYTAVFFENARCVYFSDLLSQDETVAPVDGYTNRIRRDDDDDEGGFVENGEDYPRMASLYDRDVQPGDRVYIRGVVSGDAYELETYVLGIAGDAIAASVGTATAAAGNKSGQAASTSVTQTAGTTSDYTVTPSMGNYNGYVDGYIDDTYTLEVVSGSAGGDLTTAVLRLTSASGLDNESDISPSAVNTFFYVGARGLRVRFSGAATDLVAGQKWQMVTHGNFERPTMTAGGTYTGATDTTYIVEVVKGGLFDADDDADKPYVQVRTTTGVDASNGRVMVSDISEAIPIGTKGVTLTPSGTGSAGAIDGLRKDDVWTIAVVAEATGRMGTLILGHDLPEELLDATDLDLKLWIEKDIEIEKNREGFDPLTNWDTSATEITLNSGIVVYDDSWTDGGDPVPLTVETATAYVQYRAWLQTFVGNVGSKAADEALDDAIAGELDEDNPLKYGVFVANLNAGGTPVFFTAVSDPSDLDAWQAAADQLLGNSDVYSIVPLSTDVAVGDIFAGLAASESSKNSGRPKVAWVPVVDKSAVVRVSAATSDDDDVVLATISDDPDTSGTQYTRVAITSGNAGFLDLNVVAGDEVRFGFQTSFGESVYETAVVDEVISETSLRLVSGPSVAVGTGQKIEVWHPLTKSQLATDNASQAAHYGSKLVRAVWSDLFDSTAHELSPVYLCCALAGLRGGAAPHQSLTNVEVLGFTPVAAKRGYLNATQLNTMAESGVWIVTADVGSGAYTRHGLTTDPTDLNTFEEATVTNLHSLETALRNRYKNFKGRYNASPAMDERLLTEGEATLGELKQIRYAEELGPQLLSGEIVSITKSTLRADARIVNATVEITRPLNFIDIIVLVT